MENNPFKLLESENENLFFARESSIKKNIKGRKDIWSHLGDIAETYLPKLIFALFGGSQKKP